MNHLSVYAHNAIETLFYKLKLSIRKMTKTIGRSLSTISRELKRNCYKGYYDLKKAQTKSQKRALKINKDMKFGQKFKFLFLLHLNFILIRWRSI